MLSYLVRFRQICVFCLNYNSLVVQQTREIGLRIQGNILRILILFQIHQIAGTKGIF